MLIFNTEIFLLLYGPWNVLKINLQEYIEVKNAVKIPIVAVVDSNSNPEDIDFPIPGNDDAIRSVALLTRVIADAIAAGLQARSGAAKAKEDAAAAAQAEALAASATAELEAAVAEPVVAAEVAPTVEA